MREELTVSEGETGEFQEIVQQWDGTRDTSTAESWRILVVASARPDADTLVGQLREHGHSASSVDTGVAALSGYTDADLMLIDLELPDLDGLEVCREIRATCELPIIAVTARATELDRVLGLQAGADDYVPKPYGISELLARIEAVMRRAQPKTPSYRTVVCGPLCIDVKARQVTVGDRQVILTRKEFDLLHTLAAHQDAVISRKQLMEQIWGNSWSRRTVDTHVNSLRAKLGSSSWIVTVRGIGFRLGWYD